MDRNPYQAKILDEETFYKKETWGESRWKRQKVLELLRGRYRKDIDARKLAMAVQKLVVRQLESAHPYISVVGVAALLSEIEKIFDTLVWITVERVYETRWDCRTVRLMAA